MRLFVGSPAALIAKFAVSRLLFAFVLVLYAVVAARSETIRPAPGTDLGPLVAALKSGDEVLLEAGTYLGPVQIVAAEIAVRGPATGGAQIESARAFVVGAFDGSKIKLENVALVSGADDATALVVQNSVVELGNCSISISAGTAIYVESSALSLSGCQINQIPGRAIVAVSGSTVSINSSTISNVLGDVAIAVDGGGVLRLDNVDLENIAQVGIYTNAGVTVGIEGAKFSAIGDAAITVVGAGARISHTRIESVGMGIRAQSSNLTVENTNIEHVDEQGAAVLVVAGGETRIDHLQARDVAFGIASRNAMSGALHISESTIEARDAALYLSAPGEEGYLVENSRLFSRGQASVLVSDGAGVRISDTAIIGAEIGVSVSQGSALALTGSAVYGGTTALNVPKSGSHVTELSGTLFLGKVDASGLPRRSNTDLLAQSSFGDASGDLAQNIALMSATGEIGAAFKAMVSARSTAIQTQLARAATAPRPAVVPPAASLMPVGFDDVANFHRSLVEPGGILSIKFRDISLPGRGWPLELVRTYRDPIEDQKLSFWSPFGDNWYWNHGVRISSNEADLLVHRADGRTSRYLRGTDKVFRPDAGISGDVFRPLATGKLRREFPDGRSELYDPWITARSDTDGVVQIVGYYNYLPVDVTELSGRTLQFEYKEGQTPRLVAAIGPDGTTRERTYEYDENHRLVSVADPLGRATRMDYDGAGRLARVTFPDGEALQVKRDSVGRVIALTGPGAVTTTFTHETDVKTGSMKLSATGPTGRTSTLNRLASVDSYQEFRDGGDGNLAETEFGPASAQLVLPGQPPLYATRDEAGEIIVRDAAGAEVVSGLPEKSAGANDLRLSMRPGEQLDATGLPKLSLGPAGWVTTRRDEYGRPVEIADTQGTLALSYDAAGQLISMQAAGGDPLRLNYDADGRLTLMAGDSFSYNRTYDRRGLVQRVEIDGKVWEYEYDAAGKMVAMSGPEGRLDIGYDKAGKPNSYVSDLGESIALKTVSPGVEEIRFDDGNLIRTKLGPEGFPRRIARVVEGEETDAIALKFFAGRGALKAQMSDESGLVQSWRDDAGSDLTESRLGDDVLLTERRDDAGRLVSSKSEDVGVSVGMSDDGNRTVVKATDGRRLELVRDADGQLAEMRDENGTTISYRYDGQGRMVSKSTVAQGRTLTQTYRYVGEQLVEISGSDGQVVAISRDSAGRLSGLGSLGLEYDGSSRLSATIVDGEKTPMRYDSLDRLVEIGGARPVHYGYDESERWPSSVENATGEKWDFRRDDRGQLVSVALPGGGTRQLHRDAAGRIVALEDGAGRIQDVLRDASGRISGLGIHGGPAVRYRFSPFGEIAAIARESGEIRFVRDGFGRLIKVVSDGSSSASFEYKRGRLERATTALGTYVYSWGPLGFPKTAGDPFGGHLNYRYDDQWRLVGLRYNNGAEISYRRGERGHVAALKLDGGPEINVKRTDSDRSAAIGFDAGSSFDVTYDDAGLPVEIRIAGPSGITLGGEAYRRDAIGTPVEITALSTGAQTRLVYDASARLTGIKSDDRTKTLAFDSSGNVTRIGGHALSYDAAYRIASFDGAAVRYDDDGNLAGIPGVISLRHNRLGQIVEATRAGQAPVHYAYDHAGHLAERRTGADRRRYVYDDVGRVARVLDGKDAVIARIDWIPDVAGIALVTLRGEEPELLVPNPVGTPIAAVTKRGAVRPISIGLWGGTTHTGAELAYGAIGFSGAVMDPETGLVFFGSRAFLSDIGRFTSPDPAGAGGGFNPYAYALNSPLLFSDPTGEQPTVEVPFGPPNTHFGNPQFPLGPSVPAIRGNMAAGVSPLVMQDLEYIARVAPDTSSGRVARETLDMIRRGHVEIEYHQGRNAAMGIVEHIRPKAAQIFPETILDHMRRTGVPTDLASRVRQTAGVVIHETTHVVQNARAVRAPFVIKELEARVRQVAYAPRMAGVRNPGDPIGRIIYQTIRSAARLGRDVHPLTAAEASRIIRPYFPNFTDMELRQQAQLAIRLHNAPGNQVRAPGLIQRFAARGQNPFSGQQGLGRFGRGLRLAGAAGLSAVSGLLEVVNAVNYLDGRISTRQYVTNVALHLGSALVQGTPLGPIMMAHGIGSLLGSLAAHVAINEMLDPTSADGRILRYLLDVEMTERSRHPCNVQLNCHCSEVEAGFLTVPWRKECRSCQSGLRQQCMQTFQETGDAEAAVLSTGSCRTSCAIYGESAR